MEALLARLSQFPITETEARLRAHFLSLRLRSAQLKRAPAVEYFEWTLEQRRRFMQAPSTACFCKTIIMLNSYYNEAFANEPGYFKYVAVVIQYEDKLSAEKVMKYMKKLQNEQCRFVAVSNKHFHFHLAEEEDAKRLTGYSYNAITPVLMRTSMPVLLTAKALALQPAYIWMGGGELDLKLGLSVSEFLQVTKAHVVDVSY